MKGIFQFLFLAAVLFCCANCAGPHFEPITAPPSGHAIVYIYSLTDVSPGNGVGGGLNRIARNNVRLGKLGPRQCIADFPKPGKIVYSVEASWVTRGGLIGHMFLDKPEAPAPAVLSLEEGRTYFLRVIGGQTPKFMRMDDDNGLGQLQRCHRVRTENPE